MNLNRLTESLKFIEDYTRFELRTPSLLNIIRTIRKDFFRVKKSLPIEKIIFYRQSEIDLGRKPEFDKIERQAEKDILLANFSRAKESVRILEELLRLKNKGLGRCMKKIRFRIYDLERTVIETDYKKFNPKLCAIIDEKYIDKIPLKETVRILQDNGATMIQLRIKSLPDRKFYFYGERLRKYITNSRVKFVINDRVDIALSINADGVHLGQNDIPVERARQIMGDRFIIGASAHNLKEAVNAQKEGADYLGIGAIFPTTTKFDAKVCGIELIRRLRKRVNIPIIAIGGINKWNYKEVIKTGADGIAVASYLFEGNLKKNLQALDFNKKNIKE